MKKILTILTLAVLTLSCSVKDDGKDIDTTGYTLFTADLESLQGLTPWSEGSTLGVFGTQTGTNSQYILRKKFVGSTLAEFYGPLVEGNILAYYPYNALLRTENGSIPFEVPATQIYAPQATPTEFFASTVNRAFAKGENGALHFVWGCGLLEVTLGMTEPVEVSGFSLTATDAAISGTFLADGDCEISPSSSATSKIAIDFAGATYQSREGDDFMKVLLCVPAGQYNELVLKISSPVVADMVAKVKDITIEKISSSEVRISSVTVGVGDIPALPVDPGYLEE